MAGPPPCVILDAPQMAENIGAVARVMANFGLHDLRIARPRDGWPQARAWVSASGADWVLEGARSFDNVAAAAADVRLLFAATARPRDIRTPLLTPRTAAAELSRAAGEGLATGLLFGGERAGLETADIARAQGIVTIPIDPRHHSLNLAQAVAITAYEWRLTVLDTPPPAFPPEDPPAAIASMEGLFGQLEAELQAGGFFHPPEKKPAMIRNLRTPLSRARFTEQEVRTFRGVVTALVKGRGQALKKGPDTPSD